MYLNNILNRNVPFIAIKAWRWSAIPGNTPVLICDFAKSAKTCFHIESNLASVFIFNHTISNLKI